MENKSVIIKAVLGAVALIVLLFINPLSYNDAGERTVVEQFDGKQFVQYAPGVYYAGFFAKERPWPNQISVSYQADAPDLDLRDGTIEIGKQTIRFGGDATSAAVSGIVQYILPMDEKEMIEMHNAHRTPQSLVQKRLAPTIAEVVMWLYEKHGIWINISITIQKEYFYNCADITGKKDPTKNNYPSVISKSGNYYNSPTEAYEAGIKYTLNNLI